jgi:hypothetical protein
LVDGKLRPCLHNIRKLAAVVTYGGERWRALLVGDPPRKIVKRVVRAVVHPGVRTRYIALYGMNRDVEADRRAFLRRVATEMRRF